MVHRIAVGRISKYSAIALGCVVVLLPIWFLAVASFRPLTVLMEYPPKLWPNDGNLNNYRTLLDPVQFKFGFWFLNSVVYSGSVTIGSLVLSSLAGYAFAKKSFPGKRFLFTLAISTMMIPFTVTLIPLFLTVKSLGLMGTRLGMILPVVAAPFGVFLMRQFIMTLPSSLEESARLDGCSELRVFLSIIMPMSKPAVAVLAIYTFMTQWNNLLWPLVIGARETMKTLTVGIAGLRYQSGSPWGLMMAASILSFLPVLIFFLFSREQFIEGLTAGALKG